MKMNWKTGLIGLAVIAVFAGSAYGSTITISYTADDAILSLFYYAEGGSINNLELGTNVANWRTADTLDISVEDNTSYTFIWKVDNTGNYSSTNPAGFLASLTSSYGQTLYTSTADWWVSTNGYRWYSALSYGSNASTDDNIWDNVSGIDDDALWIWNAYNFETRRGARSLYIKTSFSVTPTPEPATIFLFGAGLAGLGAVVRKRKKS